MDMGLTFEQKFSYIPEEILLVTTDQGAPLAILEKPENIKEENTLRVVIGFTGSPKMVKTLKINELVKNGFELKKAIIDKYGRFESK